MTPMLQISTLLLYGFDSVISGALYIIVPHHSEIVWEREIVIESPKSISWICSGERLERRMLFILISRWVIPFEWRKETASRIWFINSFFWLFITENIFIFINFSMPNYPITINMKELSSYTSTISIIFLCLCFIRYSLLHTSYIFCFRIEADF